MRRLKAFALFWVDFIVGDDYSVAAGIVVTLGLCAALSKTSIPAWWIAPLGVLGVLCLSVTRAALQNRRKEAQERAAEAVASGAERPGDAGGAGQGLAAGADPVVRRVDAGDPEALGVGPAKRLE